VRYRTLADEVGAINGGTGGRGGASLREALAAEDSASNAALYLLLRAADRVHAASGCAARQRPRLVPDILLEYAAQVLRSGAVMR